MGVLNTWRLTNFSKILIVLAFIGIAAGVCWKLGYFDEMSNEVAAITAPKEKSVQTTIPQQTSVEVPISKIEEKPIFVSNKPISTSKNRVRISLDEWIGWKPIFDANGGLVTAKGSIFDKLGLDIELVVINDATQSSNALISKDLVGAGFTLNRLAYLMDKFDRANVSIVVPFLCNNSSGGDGIISKKSIKSIEGLVGKKIVAPRFSEAQTLVYWFLYNSNLSPVEISSIVNDMILVNTPDDAAKVFFSGKADAAATWQPYLDQANDPNSDTHALITTKQATNLILDVIVFRKDFYENNKEFVAKFADGVFQAHNLYTSEFRFIKNMANFTSSSDEEIKAMTMDASLANYKKNIESLSSEGISPKVFQDMLKIWKLIGEQAKVGSYSEIFDLSALELLSSKYKEEVVPVITYTQEQRQTATKTAPVMTKSLTIEFDVNSAVFKDPSATQKALNEIIYQLNIVDNVIVQIEGNTSSEGARQLNMDLSYSRANAVAKYLMRNGINPSRLVVIGNGPDKPTASNSTNEGRIKNRRTDVMLKSIE